MASNETPYEPLSRRRFLLSAGATSTTLLCRLGPAAIALLAQAACSAKQDAAAFTVLGVEPARDFAAMAARVIPTTETPGATEAGVIHFFDQAFATDMAEAMPWALAELSNFNATLGTNFAGLSPGAQDDALRAIESGPFFELVRLMTLFGFFAMSRYGGNRDSVGWSLVGFDGHHGAWTYPFGFYDAAAQESSSDS